MLDVVLASKNNALTETLVNDLVDHINAKDVIYVIIAE